MSRYFKVIFFILSSFLFADINFYYPQNVPDNLPPDISLPPRSATDSYIVTDYTGSHAYIIWQRYDGSNSITQVASTSDFGNSWIYPNLVPQGSSYSPNLSRGGNTSFEPKIVTNSTGKFVYAIWARFNASDKSIIQTAISQDYGKSWQDPNSTTGTGHISPNLSEDNKNANQPQITTDSSGAHVYAVWSRVNDFSYTIVQVARSTNFGKDWIYPDSTPQGSPNLSEDGNNAGKQNIATSESGQFVYAIWKRETGITYLVQTARSLDYGAHWEYPSIVPNGCTKPNLSQPGASTGETAIVCDNSGKNVYAVWDRDQGGRVYAIQIAISSDYGATWVYPDNVPEGPTFTPNLSRLGADAHIPKIAIDSMGKNIYVVWSRDSGSHIYSAQVAISSDYGKTFTDPISVPQGVDYTPNLSKAGFDAVNTLVATGGSGRLVFASWQFNDGSNDVIQTAISNDFGVTWTNPSNVPDMNESPNISQGGQNATIGGMASSLNGNMTFISWSRKNDGINNIVQVANREHIPVVHFPNTVSPAR